MSAKKLNPKQELFCKYFASDREFFGNGVQSYIEAYGLDPNNKRSYATARANAHKLLTNTDIQERIDKLFVARGLNDTFVDKQLEKLIIQDADYGAKMAAMKEYNALKNRITKNVKTEVEVNNHSELSDEELQKKIEAYLARKK